MIIRIQALLHEVWWRVRLRWFHSRIEFEADSEIRFHLEMDAMELRRDGLAPSDSEEAARKRFGNIERIRRDCLEAAGAGEHESGPAQPARKGHMWNDILHDIRYGLRAMAGKPAFTFIAVLTLALGIGATTAIFSVVDTVLLKPLPYPNSEQLVTVWETYPHWQGQELLDDYWDHIALAYPDYLRWSEAQTSFKEVALYRSISAVVEGGDRPTEIPVGLATASLFPLLDVRAALGRLPLDEDLSGDRVLLLSHSFWQSHFGSDPEILGETVTLDVGRSLDLVDSVDSYVIIGVLPPDFRFAHLLKNPGFGVAGWTLLDPSIDRVDGGNHSYEAIARLEPDVPFERARTETEVLLRGDFDPSVRGARVLERQSQETGAIRTPLLVLLGAVSLVLLIACGNVANLLLGEAARRETEIAIRAAIGAGRGRIVRQLLTESILLALAGTLVGTLFAYWGTRALLLLAPAQLPRVLEIGIDGRVLVFATSVAVITGVLFGLVPALTSARTGAGAVINEGSRHFAPRRTVFQRLVVAAEISVSLVLLVGAALLAQTFLRMSAVDPGFDTENMLLVDVSLPTSRFAEAANRSAFYQEAVERLRSIPGIVEVTASSGAPFSGNGASSSIEVEGLDVADDEQGPESERRHVFPNYFQAARIPILKGRDFRPADARSDVIIVNQSFAERFWPGEDPIGKRINYDRAWTVVGVVADAKQGGLNLETRTTFFMPNGRERPFMQLLIRTRDDPLALATPVRREIWDIDPRLPLDRVVRMDRLISNTLAGERYRALLIGIFAMAAVLLASVGLYGVISEDVARRTHELGIRIALGARPGNIVGMVLGHSLMTIFLGVFAGVVGAAVVARLLTAALFGIAPLDVPTYVAASVLVTIVATTAGFIPALRATRVDPIVALRQE